MPKSPFVDFRAVKAAITMEQVLIHYGLLDRFKRTGDSLSGPCPIHRGSSPNQFRVSVSKNIWNCFSECKHGGNTLDFIARMENVSIHAAALKAIDWFDLDLDALSGTATEEADHSSPPPTKAVASVPRRPALAPLGVSPEKITPNVPLKFRLDKLDRSHPYLTERGLSEETIVDFGIGYCAKGMMAERIAIPIHNAEGQIVAYVGRFPGEPAADVPKYKLPQGFRKSLELFNLDRAIKEPVQQPLVIVEGFFDCMKLHQCGCRKVVALMGSAMSPAQETLLRTHTSRTSQVIIMLDEDESGQAGREDIAVRLSRFAFVQIHTFETQGMQPESLTPEQVSALVGGVV
jgi:DNA primase